MAGVPMDISPKAAGVVQVRDFFKERGRIFQKPKVGDYVIKADAAPARSG
jgi:hypothetical protein